MPLTVIIEGANNVGKTTICRMLEQWLQHINCNYTYFHDSDLYDCVVQGQKTFNLEDLVKERKEVYEELREDYDLILLDRSFMSTILYNLNVQTQTYIDEYIQRELLNLKPTPKDRLMVFIVVRDSEDALSNEYSDLAHRLQIMYHVPSHVYLTYEDLNRTFDVFKNEIYDELDNMKLVGDM